MQLETDAILHGHGLAFANRSGEKIVEIIRLEPQSVTLDTDELTLEPRYTVSLRNGGRQVYSWRDILDIPSLGGMSPIKQCADAIGLAIALERHAARIFANGARPSGVFKHPKKIDEAVFKRLKSNFQQEHAGESSGKTLLLEEGMDFTALTFNSVDLQFVELRSYQLLEVARALGVPPMLIADFGRATWGNSEQMAQSFLTFGILPRLKVWQGAISRLLSPEEQKTLYAEFIIDELVKADTAARFQAYASAVTNGILNPNEIRAMENRPPYDGGDEFRVAMNTEAPGTQKPPVALPKPRIAA